MYYLTMGLVINALRGLRNVKAKDLAISLDISKSYLSEIENGKKIPSLSLICLVSIEFDIQVSTFFKICEEVGKNLDNLSKEDILDITSKNMFMLG